MLSTRYLEIIETVAYADTAPYYANIPVYTLTVIKTPETGTEREIQPSLLWCTYKIPVSGRPLPVIDQRRVNGVVWIAFDLMPDDSRTFKKWYRADECVGVVTRIAETRERKAA